MKKTILSILITFTFTFNSLCFASMVPVNKEPIMSNRSEKILLQVLNINNLDLHSKSYRGWIRIFNNKKRINDYEIIINESERLIILNYLREKHKNENNKYKRSIR